MFKRPGDPDEHLQLYALPAAALLTSLAVGQALGVQEVTSMAYLASAGLCIGSIGCLSNQSTARTGNALGLIGVGTGIAATLGGMTAGDTAVLGQVLGTLQFYGVKQVLWENIYSYRSGHEHGSEAVFVTDSAFSRD